MTMRLLAATLSLLLATPSFAQVIPVRSGEHGSFTRLVLQVPVGTGWSLGQEGRIASLSLDLPEGQIDTREVFRRIDDRRVRSLRQAAAGQVITIELGCTCDVAARLGPDGLLVLDISEKPSDLQVRPTLPWLPLQGSYRFAGADPSEPAPGETLELPIVPALASPQSDAGNATSVPSGSEEITSFERQLLFQIARAASQGLVDPLAPRLGRNAVTEPEGPFTEEVGQLSSGPFPGVAAQTSKDRDAYLRDLSPVGDPGPAACLGQEVVAVAQWGDGRPFDVQISAARRDLTGEFDRVPPEAAMSLARTYLFFGFGAEAQAALSLVHGADNDRAILWALAHLLDGKPISPTGPLAGQVHCDDEVALWSFLAGPAPDRSIALNLAAIKRSYTALPRHLRETLGPEVSRRLTLADDPTGAQEVLLSMTRAGIGDSGDSLLAKAEIAIADGEIGAADALLMDVAMSTSQQAPIALVQLVENAWRTGGTVAPSETALAAAFATEFRATDLGHDLLLAQALSLGMQGDFRAAFGLAESLTVSPERAELLSRLFALLTSRADDMAFLERTLPNPSAAGATVIAGSRIAMARRLLALGFPQQADMVLRHEAATVTPERILLKAEIALALDQPHQALVVLIGERSEAARQLRAAALLRTGRPSEAAEVLAQLAEPDLLPPVGRQAGDATAEPAEENGSLAEMSRLSSTLAGMTPVASSEAALGTARTLLGQSEAVRQQVDALLQVIRED